MILDEHLIFADSENVASTAGTSNTAQVIDLGVAGRDLHGVPNMSLYIGVAESFAGSGASVAFRLVSDSTPTPATNGSATQHWESGPIPIADLAQNNLPIIVPMSVGQNMERYLGLQVITSGATTTAGAINAMLVLDAQKARSYPEAVN